MPRSASNGTQPWHHTLHPKSQPRSPYYWKYWKEEKNPTVLATFGKKHPSKLSSLRSLCGFDSNTAQRAAKFLSAACSVTPLLLGAVQSHFNLHLPNLAPWRIAHGTHESDMCVLNVPLGCLEDPSPPKKWIELYKIENCWRFSSDLLKRILSCWGEYGLKDRSRWIYCATYQVCCWRM